MTLDDSLHDMSNVQHLAIQLQCADHYPLHVDTLIGSGWRKSQSLSSKQCQCQGLVRWLAWCLETKILSAYIHKHLDFQMKGMQVCADLWSSVDKGVCPLIMGHNASVSCVQSACSNDATSGA